MVKIASVLGNKKNWRRRTKTGKRGIGKNSTILAFNLINHDLKRDSVGKMTREEKKPEQWLPVNVLGLNCKLLIHNVYTFCLLQSFDTVCSAAVGMNRHTYVFAMD